MCVRYNGELQIIPDELLVNVKDSVAGRTDSADATTAENLRCRMINHVRWVVRIADSLSPALVKLLSVLWPVSQVGYLKVRTDFCL